MISVLYLIDQIETQRAGSEQHLCWLLNNLPNEKVQKSLAVFSNLKKCEPEDFTVVPRVFGREYGEGVWNFRKRFFGLVKDIKENKYNIVHAFTPQDELVAVFACRCAGYGKVVAHRRNIGYILNRKIKAISRIVQFFKIPYIANSEAAKEAAFRLEKIGLDRITVIHNPVSWQRCNDGLQNPVLRSDIPIPPEAKIVGMCATVRPIKGYETLIQAAGQILKKHPNTYFLCVGEQLPDYFAELKTLAEKLNVSEKIIWYGGIENPYRILPFFDIAVLSSFSESFSNSVLEYAVTGRPIVASDVGGMQEIISDGETGFLVPPNEPQQLANRIIQLLDDPDLCFSFGAAAQRYALREFAEDIIIREYLDFYNKTV